MRIEIITDQSDFFAAGIAALKQSGCFKRPVRLGPAGTGDGLPPPGKWLGEHENTCGTVTFVFIIDLLQNSKI